MQARPLGTEPPRPPLFGRITPSQWTAVDVCIAGLFLIGFLAYLFGGHTGSAATNSKWILGPLYVLASVPIAFRRRWPEVSLVLICGAVTATTMLGYSLAPAPLIAFPLYSVTVKYSRRQSLAVLVAVEALSVLAVGVAALFRPVRGDVTFNVFLAAAIWFVGDSVRTRRAYQAGLIRQAEEEQRRQLDRAQRAVVEERLEIARELHDVVAHSLSVIAIQSGVGRHVIDSQPEEARRALEAVEYTSRSALDELRRVLGNLRRSGLGSRELSPAPTLSDLDELVSTVQAAGIPVDLQMAGDFEPIPSGLEQSIYRIVQEALTNVAKHTHGASTTVNITSTEGRVLVEVLNAADPERRPLTSGNGVGRNGSSDSSDHHGIIGMKERAAAFGGSLTAATMPEGGFRVMADLPYRDGA